MWPALAAGGEYVQFDGNGEEPHAWSLSAQLRIPIDPSSRKRAESAQAQAQVARQAQRAALREAQRDWLALHSAYETARADINALAVETTARREVVRVQAELQRVGLVSLEDFLRQQRDQLEAEARLTQAQAGAITAWSAGQVLRGASTEDYISALEAREASSR